MYKTPLISLGYPSGRNRFLALFFFFLAAFLTVQGQKAYSPVSSRFNLEKDLLLAHYDCKTDVDDLHSVAAFRTLLSKPAYAGMKYHAVAGTYGTQEGLYVPPNDLFELAFEDNWTDAHADFEAAVEQVKPIVMKTLENKGQVWVAEGGQSDFSAALARAVRQEMPDIDLQQAFHIVQHSDWNEEVTTPEDLQFVIENTSYHKIPDGNASGNGTPDFRSDDFRGWEDYITDPKLKKIWQRAVDLGHTYNAKEGRYNNESVAAGGLDFSDTVEICWMLGLENLKDIDDFFRFFVK